MGDVKLPLRLCSAHFISISTASCEEDLRYPPSNNASRPLSLAICKPPRKLLKLISSSSRRRKAHASEGGEAKASGWRMWHFFLRRKATSHNGSSSDTRSVACTQNNSPKDRSLSSSISPSSVLEKKLYADGNSNEEDNADKIRFDSSGSSTRSKDSGELQIEVSGGITGKQRTKDEAFESSAGNHFPLSRPLVSSLDEQEIATKDNNQNKEKETNMEDINQCKDEMKADDRRSKTTSSITCCDILKVDGSLPRRKSSASLFRRKRPHGDSNSRGLSSMTSRMHFNKRAAISVMSLLSLKKRKKKKNKQQQHQANGGCTGDELWNRRILMGRRCQDRRDDDCYLSLDNGVELCSRKVLVGNRCQESIIPPTLSTAAPGSYGDDEVEVPIKFDAKKESIVVSSKELMALEAEHFNNAVPFKGLGFSS